MKEETTLKLRDCVRDELKRRRYSVEGLAARLDIGKSSAWALLTTDEEHPFNADTWLWVIDELRLPIRVMVVGQKPHAEEDIAMETGQRPSLEWD